MLENLKGNKFEYKRLTEAEQKARGILGRLVGPCADFINPTRNGRKYSESLWENVFNNPIMKEKIANKVCFGELGHPENRTETDMEKIAICLAEQPKKGKDGILYGVFDILSTPNGRILKSLCDYGCNIGISSRGQGDLITDDNGDEAVDPDTYDCECFDAVLVPGVEIARLKYVTESLDKKALKLKKALKENLNNANENERKIMSETLRTLNINLNEAKEDKVEEPDTSALALSDEEVANINKPFAEVDAEFDSKEEAPAKTKKTRTAKKDRKEKAVEIADPEDEEIDIEIEDNSSSDINDEDVENKETEVSEEDIFLDFLANNFDEKDVRKVCKILNIEIEEDEENLEDNDNNDTPAESDKNEDSDEDINSNEDSEQVEENSDKAVDDGLAALVSNLKEAIKAKSDLENQVKSLQEKLAVSDAKVNKTESECNKYKEAVTRLSALAKSNKDLKESVSGLEKELETKTKLLESQKTRINKLIQSRRENMQDSNALNESINKLTSVKADYEAKIKSLNEELNNSKEEHSQSVKTLTENLNKQIAVKEGYKKLANKAVNKYIEIRADILGLTAKDIKRKLGESYTMEDVDQVCKDLKSYQLNVSKLPFDVNRKVSIKVNESCNNSIKPATKTVMDDDVDDTLIRLANFEN